jgi:phosphate starvation-inducible PhoH-like protein
VDARVNRPAASRAVARVVVVPDQAEMFALLGREDATLRAVEALVPDADIHVRGDRIAVRGAPAPAALAVELIEELVAVVRRGGAIGPDDARRVFTMLTDQPTAGVDLDLTTAPAASLGMAPGAASDAAPRPAEILTQSILSSRGRTVRPKTLGQKRYVDAIDGHTVTFGIGPAGTGKTYLAMAKAVQALQSKQVARIVLTRPAVEAGERLGFLPGTLNEKIDPYLRPLYDALQDMLDSDSIPRLIEAGTIEVAPLAYMRGRTLNDAFIILDEAQNTSSEQMKMFLTRLGFGAKMVVTGDVTQTDLPGGTASGLLQVRTILTGLEDLAFCELTSKDVVRHRLVSQIIDAYARDEAARAACEAPDAGGWDSQAGFPRAAAGLPGPRRPRGPRGARDGSRDEH